MRIFYGKRYFPVLACSIWLIGGMVIGAEKSGFADYGPIVTLPHTWIFNEYWLQKRIGARDFYYAESGPYMHMYPKLGKAEGAKQLGLLSRTIPGYWTGYKKLNGFAPSVRKTLPLFAQKLIETALREQWPIHSIEYCRHHGNPAPLPEAIRGLGDLWLGDGHPEQPYRLEPVFHYLRKGEKKGCSWMYCWKNDEALKQYFDVEVIPLLQKQLPFYTDEKHGWTRPELRRLCDIYCETFFHKVGKPVAWGMYLSPYHLAGMPGVTTIGEKGADSRHAARARGLMRRFADKKFFMVWRGFEPTERYGYYNRADVAQTMGSCRESWGYPLPLLRYYIFRPFLIGANYYTNELLPAGGIQDIEGDKQYELSASGRILKDMLDFVDRHPERGTVYSPVALLRDYDRPLPSESPPGTTYRGYNLPFDRADHMTYGIIELLFPEHRHVRFSGDYGCVAPYGEIFDVVVGALPGRGVDLRALENYKVLFALGGLAIDKAYARALEQYVRNGGILVINVADIGTAFSPDFFGVKLLGENRRGREAVNRLTGKRIKENEFTFAGMQLGKATSLYTCNGQPLVTSNAVGKGTVILVGAQYMVQDSTVRVQSGRHARSFDSHRLLRFADDFIEHLTAGLCPVTFRRRPEDKQDLSWIINKKGNGWTVTVFNYSLERELLTKAIGAGSVLDQYPLKALPFEIICNVPVADVMELYEDRDVRWSKRDGHAVISESIRGGEIRVYEIQPKPIRMKPRTRFVNYALNRPVRVSSIYKDSDPAGVVVDGIADNAAYWQSDSDPNRHYRFDMPQWLEVDLQQSRVIDHVYVQFHAWPLETLDTRLRVYKYMVEVSPDREKWQIVLDERKNEDPARGFGLERWFEPVTARYARLTILRNSAFSGAQVVEFKVMGAEKEEYLPKRKSIIPMSRAVFSERIQSYPQDKIVYLQSLTPQKIKPGWMPAGSQWKWLNRTVKLYCHPAQEPTSYPHSLYGQSNFAVTYAVPAKAIFFVAAAGLGVLNRVASVRFHVFVDGAEKYTSSLYRTGMPVLPIVVDVSGARTIRLVTDDGGDGIRNDYAWWGAARFLLDQ